jgi:hypothetical protein
MRRKIGLLGLAVALALSAPAAQAGIPTSIVRDGTGQSEGNANISYFVGHLEAPNVKCVIGRKVKVSFFYLGSPLLVDVARSTQTGAFAGEGPTLVKGGPITGYRLQVSAKKIGPKGHRKTCAGFQDEFGM